MLPSLPNAVPVCDDRFWKNVMYGASLSHIVTRRNCNIGRLLDIHDEILGPDLTLDGGKVEAEVFIEMWWWWWSSSSSS